MEVNELRQRVISELMQHVKPCLDYQDTFIDYNEIYIDGVYHVGKDVIFAIFAGYDYEWNLAEKERFIYKSYVNYLVVYKEEKHDIEFYEINKKYV